MTTNEPDPGIEVYLARLEYQRSYRKLLEEMQPEIRVMVHHRMNSEEGLPHLKLLYRLITWDLPVSEKRKALGWSHQTYTRFLDLDVNRKNPELSLPDISSRLGVKYRRDPLSREARNYLHRINLLQRKLGEPEWAELPEAPVKKWVRRNPKPAKNEAVEKPNPPKTGAVKNEFEEDWEVF